MAFVPMRPHSFQQRAACDHDSTVADPKPFLGAVTDRCEPGLASRILNPQAGQPGEPCGLLALIVEMEIVLTIEFGPVSRIGHTRVVITQCVPARMSGLAIV